MIKNPHNLGTRIFPLKREMKHAATMGCKVCGPHFSGIRVLDKCNTHMDNDALLGNCYINNTGLDGHTVFTGSGKFQVMEIVVFEVCETFLPRFPALDSLIVSAFPEIFDDFRTKRFSLLWRGSRDGFRARDFHARCDGHANTLTVIEDTNGNVFGGFTPVKWESRVQDWWLFSPSNCYKADRRLESFLFTLKNPHELPPRKFRLRDERSHMAIKCDCTWGPHFSDIYVCDNCNATTESFTSDFGSVYCNDTIVRGTAFFTTNAMFRVKEIEVFEIN
jgi:hypothetical protein